MTTAVSACVVGALDVAAPINEEARAQVWALLAGIYPHALVERRRDQRYPFPRLLTLLPVDGETLETVGAYVTAVGKHISESGLGFYHPDPLPFRWIVVSVDNGQGVGLRFLVDVNWCRFTRQGWYESGGRFVRALGNGRI
ncbi:MAG TPA: hypothetical protein VG713_11555 [Pirellulales bacterium]|nr:hypothetical protein [Pirellulales bacterium]